MSRTIKFRAWDKTKKRWLDVLAFLGTGNGYLFDSSLQGFDEDIELMQFTGLLDKNGKEIYEGDVVSFVFRTSKEELVCAKVIFRNGTFGYLQDESIKKHIYSYEFWPLSEGKAETVEIIGNIYENPELLQ